MGWTFTAYPSGTVKQHLDSLINWESGSCINRVIDSSVVERKTYYAAVERINKETGAREVWAAVFLVKFYRDEFGYKDMDETVGPSASECPERIMKLLTPTTYEHAIAWRQRCWNAINRRKLVPRLAKGMRLIFTEALQFGNKHLTEFTVVSAKGRLVVTEAGGMRIPFLRDGFGDRVASGELSFSPAATT